MSQYINQVSVFVENNPGSAAKVFCLLADENINIRALSLSDADKYGLIRMIVDQPERAVALLNEANFTAALNPVLGIYLYDEPGTLCQTMNVIGRAGYNIEYLYAFVTRKQSTAMVILRVEGVDEPLFTLLAAYGIETATDAEAYGLA